MRCTRILTFCVALLAVFVLAAYVPFAPNTAPHVLTNAALQSSCTGTTGCPQQASNVFPEGVWRDDFSTGLGAPPLFYRPSSTACSFVDNGYQVASADNKCWIAAFIGGADVREWGAKCDGVTNDTAAINAAQNITANLIYPSTKCIIATSPTTAFNSQTLITGGAATGNINVNNHWDVYNSNIQPFMQIVETPDTTTSANHPTLGIYHKFGGPGTGDGGRMGLWVDLVQDGDITPTTNPNPFQTGIFSNVWAKSGNGGGEYYGYAAQVYDDLNIVHYGTVGGEIDIALHTPGAQIKEGWGIASVPLGPSGPDAFHGSNYSAGLGIWAGGSCPSGGSGAGGSKCAGFNIGISFGRSDSFIGVSQAGSLIETVQGIGSTAGMTVANGINAGNLTVTGNYENWGGKFSIDSNGDMTESTALPQIRLNNTNIVLPTGGGLVRLAAISGGAYAWQINTAAAGDFSTVISPMTMAPTGTFELQAFTVSTLPTCGAGSKFQMAAVADLSAAPTYRQTGLAGSGTIPGLVMCNGTAWEAH